MIEQLYLLNTMQRIILFNIVLIPLTAYLDYLLLKENYRKITGGNPGKWFWIWPCFLEIMLFNAGIILGSTL